jgi:hypothetical protein
MKTKHTKGPWKTQGNLIFSLEHVLVAKLFTLPRKTGETVAHIEAANARLIAAAPEMLEMLKRLSKISTMDANWDCEILKLIDKAGGRE